MYLMGNYQIIQGILFINSYIHLVGLVTFLIIMKIKDKKGFVFKKQIPLYMYCGGCIGVLTVIFSFLRLVR